MFGPWFLNEIWITNLSSALIGMLMSSSKLFLFSKEVHFISGVRLLLELYCAVVIKRVAFFTILAKLIMVFTCASVPLNLYTSIFECVCGFGFEQKFWRIDRFGEKKDTDRRIYIPQFTPLLERTCLEEHLNLSKSGFVSEEGHSGCKSQNIAIRTLKGNVLCQIWFKWNY